MRWQLRGAGWPVGHPHCPQSIPAGTILSGVAGPDGELAEPPTWHGQTLPMPMPLDAGALDEESALQMCMWYDESATIGGWHQLHFAPGIDRKAVLAQARHNKRWPNGVPSQSTTQPISEAPIVVKEEKPRRPSRRR